MEESKWNIDEENQLAYLQDSEGNNIASVLNFCGRLVLVSEFLENESYIKLKINSKLNEAVSEANEFLHTYCLEKVHEYTLLKYKLPQNSVVE